jgi:hypothetical protein
MNFPFMRSYQQELAALPHHPRYLTQRQLRIAQMLQRHHVQRRPEYARPERQRIQIAQRIQSPIIPSRIPNA